MNAKLVLFRPKVVLSIVLVVVLVAFVVVNPRTRDRSTLGVDFAGALRGCEAWVLDRDSWSKGPAAFLSKFGLEGRMAQASAVDESSLPPPGMRDGNRYFGIYSTKTDGYTLVVSDKIPICHITGGGVADFQPYIEGVLDGKEFGGRWQKLSENTDRGMRSTTFRSKKEPRFHLMVNRAAAAGQWSDRKQLVVSAILDVRR